MRQLSLVILCVGLAGFAPARADDPALDSAVYLLKRATQADSGQMRHVVLRALRQMRDPKLEPLFAELVQSDDPLMRVHGILGLAETSPQRQIDIELVRTIKQPLPLARLITAAVDDDLINAETSRALLSWSTLDPSVRAVLAARLVSTGEVKTPAEIDRLFAATDSVPVQCIAELLKSELKGESPLSLRGLEHTEQETAARIKAMLLAVAMRFELKAVGPWAITVATDRQNDLALRLLGLRAALRYGGEPAQVVLSNWWGDADGDAERMRLALVALDVAAQVEPGFFELINKSATDDSDPTERVLAQIARVGMHIANGEPDVDAMVDLIETDHVPSARWALRYVGSAPPEVGRPVLVALIKTGDREGRFRGQRLEHVVLATQHLCELLGKDPGMLRDLFSDVGPLTQEAMLMGLIRVRDGDPALVVSGRDQWPTPTAASMALLVEAKHRERLSESELEHLSRIVRGGGGLLLPLRTQAAWLYLERTQQQRTALVSILDTAPAPMGN